VRKKKSAEAVIMMETAFPKSISFDRKYRKIDEIQWSIVSGVHEKNFIIILRNASFHGDAGKTASKVFGRWKGSAGGHRNAARRKSHWKTYWMIRKTNPDLLIS